MAGGAGVAAPVMRSILLILYIVCFGCYLLFSRQPDYLDGELTPATIEMRNAVPYAVYVHNSKTYAVDASYPLRSLQQGEKIKVIFETGTPEKAVLYRTWGYWVKWDELLGSLVLLGAMYLIAVSVTNQPTPESLMEQLSWQEEDKPKYDA